jgi:UDP-N-acetylmuramoyl-L-alanyl-D-glutamate--2,6-diaminopimelate ligase
MDRPVHSSAGAVSLRQLVPEAHWLNAADLTINEATAVSGECRPGTVFAVIRGTQRDGAEFIAEALSRGACGLLTERAFPEFACPQCLVPNARAAFARVCAALAGHPSRRLRVVGVTGTNGKTTVTWMLRSIFRQAGFPTGVLGTVEYHDGVHGTPAALTTPDARTLATWLGRMVAAGTTHAAIELSSHALHQDRAAGTELQAAIVTNITQDHFDYHGSFDEYRRCKARIAELLAPQGLLILNRDDPGSWSVRELMAPTVPWTTFSLSGAAEVCGQVLEESLGGGRFQLTVRGQSAECWLRVIGRHNVANALAAAAAADHLGVPLAAIVGGLEQFRGAPGRLERIETGQPFELFVDYAHTDDALRRCLQGLRSLAPGRLICVFGAGGNRDRGKRPLLGRAAALADVPIVTSDNPRHEDPLQIIDEILAGLKALNREAVVEPDRAAAIQTAIDLAQPGDCILVAGKGHEREQIIGDVRVPFDDRSVARALLSVRQRPSSDSEARPPWIR